MVKEGQMNIKEPGLSGFENNSVSHSQPLPEGKRG